MSTPHNAAMTAATAEAYQLFDRLTDSTRRDRAAFTLGYILALDDLGDDLPPGRYARHILRGQALQDLSDQERT
jgi:hypothetical protein